MLTVMGKFYFLPLVETCFLRTFSHDAQPCYCGEVNCVGFIGGKTQTDIAAMDDVVLDGMWFIRHWI